MSKNSQFKNERVVEIEANGLEGTVTLPVIMSADQLGIYLERSQEAIDKAREAREKEEGDGLAEIVTNFEVRFKVIRHLVLDINFPGVSIEQFRNLKAQRPFPAVLWEIDNALDETLSNALNLKNLSG